MADTYTPNLSIKHLQPQQEQPDVPVNTALDALDGAITALLPITITTADVTLTAAQASASFFIRVTGAFTADHQLIVPVRAHPYAVSHEGTGGFVLTVKTPSGTGVPIEEGQVAFIFDDGTNVVPIAGAVGATGQPYDHGFRVDGMPGAAQVLYEFTAVRDFRLPAGLLGSAGKIAGVTATGTATFPVKKNGVLVGTIIYSPTASRPTFTLVSTTDFLASMADILSIEAPSPQDATLADVQVSLKGTRF
jgi:hypothetical protein